jgi:hypothetical protein
MRLQDRPKFRGGGAVQFADFFTAARALRAISQAGLFPANCRILDPQEAFVEIGAVQSCDPVQTIFHLRTSLQQRLRL